MRIGNPGVKRTLAAVAALTALAALQSTDFRARFLFSPLEFDRRLWARNATPAASGAPRNLARFIIG